MKLKRFIYLAVLFFCMHAGISHAQGLHNDIKFDYQSNKIDIKPNLLTGFRVGLGEFPVDGPFRQFTDQPGFASEVDVGHGVNPGDVIVYNVLDRLLFWNGTDFVSPDPSTQIRISNNGAAPDTFVDGSSGHQPGSFSPAENTIGQEDGAGNIHDHVRFFLEPNPLPGPDFGAYGLKVSLSTDAVGIADSDPFMIVLSFGLGAVDLDEAVDRYADLLAPELAGDYDRSGVVDSDDYALWRQQFGTSAITSGSGADGNSDGVVDATDFTVWRDNLVGSFAGVDVNADGTVDEVDLDGWEIGYGMTSAGAALPGDADDDNDVDGVDFFAWQRQFGMSVSAIAASSTFAVPEPSTLTIVVSAVCGMLVAGDRRRKQLSI